MPLQNDDPALVTEEILRENLVVVSPSLSPAHADGTYGYRNCGDSPW